MPPAADALIFSEATSSDVFAERMPSGKGGQLPRLMAAAAKHAHELIKEFRPTQDDWRRVIAFLTEVGHASDERRQEWVLLSDLIGASALVEEINSRRPKGATPNTIRGPFFRSDVPERPQGSSISLDGVGEPLCVSALIVDLDGRPIPSAELVTWQANAQGFYENQQPDLQPEHNLRGLFAPTPTEALTTARSCRRDTACPTMALSGICWQRRAILCIGRRICILWSARSVSRRSARMSMIETIRISTRTRCLASSPSWSGTFAP